MGSIGSAMSLLQLPPEPLRNAGKGCEAPHQVHVHGLIAGQEAFGEVLRYADGVGEVQGEGAIGARMSSRTSQPGRSMMDRLSWVVRPSWRVAGPEAVKGRGFDARGAPQSRASLQARGEFAIRGSGARSSDVPLGDPGRSLVDYYYVRVLRRDSASLDGGRTIPI